MRRHDLDRVSDMLVLVRAVEAGSLRSNSGEVLRDWALAGEGLVSKSLWDVRDDLEAGRLVEVLAGFPSNDMDIVALYPNRKHMSPATRGFLTFMTRCFGEDVRERKERGG